MNEMIDHLKEIAKLIDLKNDYYWELPDGLPIGIPDSVTDSFHRNVYLKENLAPELERDTDLRLHYWIIREWGGIRSFQVGDRNDEVIRKFKSEVQQGRLTRTSFMSISSLSKLSSFCGSLIGTPFMIHALFFL
jgi:hypothetical protein